MSCIIKKIIPVITFLNLTVSTLFAMDDLDVDMSHLDTNLVIGARTCLFDGNGFYDQGMGLFRSRNIIHERIPVPEELEKMLGISEITHIPTIEGSFPQDTGAKNELHYIYPIKGKNLKILYVLAEGGYKPYLKVTVNKSNKSKASFSDWAWGGFKKLITFQEPESSEEPMSLEKSEYHPHDFLYVVYEMLYREALIDFKKIYMLRWCLQSDDIIRNLKSSLIDAHLNDAFNLLRFRDTIKLGFDDCDNNSGHVVQFGLCGEQLLSLDKSINKGDRNGDYNIIIVRYLHSIDDPIGGKRFYKKVLTIRFSEKQIDALIDKINSEL
jgi:hypothetical protein